MSSKKPNLHGKGQKPETEKPAAPEAAKPEQGKDLPHGFGAFVIREVVEKQYEFEHGEEVLIRVLDKTGIVTGIYIGASKVPIFNVEFANKDGNIQSRYFAEAELRSVEQ